MPDPAWLAVATSAGTWLLYGLIILISAVLITTAIEHFGPHAAGRATKSHRAQTTRWGPEATVIPFPSRRTVHLNRPGHERPRDWSGPEGGAA